jgi:hypothetical protein
MATAFVCNNKRRQSGKRESKVFRDRGVGDCRRALASGVISGHAQNATMASPLLKGTSNLVCAILKFFARLRVMLLFCTIMSLPIAARRLSFCSESPSRPTPNRSNTMLKSLRPRQHKRVDFCIGLAKLDNNLAISNTYRHQAAVVFSWSKW